MSIIQWIIRAIEMVALICILKALVSTKNFLVTSRLKIK